jgi:hypothetical protein
MRAIDFLTLPMREGSGIMARCPLYIAFSPCSRVRSLSSTNLRGQVVKVGGR